MVYQMTMPVIEVREEVREEVRSADSCVQLQHQFGIHH